MTAQRARAPSWLDQDERLREMWQSGDSPEEIAVDLNRTVAAVMTRAARLGLPRRFAPGRKPRKIGPKTTKTTQKTNAEREQELKRVQPDPNKQLRKCLMCQTQFYSSGPHNRICPKCKESPDWDSGSRLPDLGYGF